VKTGVSAISASHASAEAVQVRNDPTMAMGEPHRAQGDRSIGRSRRTPALDLPGAPAFRWPEHATAARPMRIHEERARGSPAPVERRAERERRFAVSRRKIVNIWSRRRSRGEVDGASFNDHSGSRRQHLDDEIIDARGRSRLRYWRAGQSRRRRNSMFCEAMVSASSRLRKVRGYGGKSSRERAVNRR